MRNSPFIRSAHRTNGTHTHTIMQPRDNEKGGVEEADVPRRGPCSPRGPTGGSALRSLFLCVRGSAATPAALMRRERKSSLRAFRPRAAGAGGGEGMTHTCWGGKDWLQRAAPAAAGPPFDRPGSAQKRTKCMQPLRPVFISAPGPPLQIKFLC